MRRDGRTIRASALVVAWLGLAGSGPAASAAEIEFNRDIRPILAENCFTCHGPDNAARKANLRLDRRAAAIEAEAIVPGKVEDSGLVDRIFSHDVEEVMPPPSSHKQLTAAQKDLLRRWIADGAEYQPHWSFLAPKRAEPPKVRDEGWVRTPVDRFILARLEARGLAHAPEADRRTLARRVTLDLTGLPPTPEAVEAFVNDPAPDAYERLVDRLMALPTYGEHRARYWLDAARYADTHGIHFDNFREVWAYRDWVIDAFNKNQPFNQFAIDQVAGDLLPNRTTAQQIATGFCRNNITTNEGGAINEEYLVLYTRDRTETFAQTFLGLTAGCAVCHDHKFDPLSQKEFYELAAFFNNTTQAAMDGNVKDTPPVLFLPAAADQGRWTALPGELTAAKQQADARKAEVRPRFDAWLAEMTPEAATARSPREGLILRARLGDRDATAPTPPGILEVADAGAFDTRDSFTVAAWVRPAAAGVNGAIVARMDPADMHRGWDLWLDNGRVGTHIIHSWSDKAIKVNAEPALKVGAWSHVLLTYDGSGKGAGVKIYVDGQLAKLTIVNDSLDGSTLTAVPLKVGQRNNSDKIAATTIRDVQLFRRALSADEAGQIAMVDRAAWLASLPAEKRPAAEVDALFAWYLNANDPPTREARARIVALEGEQGAIKKRGTVASVMNERMEAPGAFILYRGDYDKRRDPVSAGTPAALPPMAADLPRTRLGLARWIVADDHPLTARVTVNRFWQELFGTGLVRTPGDFGITGELPSHPELLDWLAVEFRESGWDMKKFFRMLVTSSAYRQGATASAEALEKDPANRDLSRGPRFRMDAEMVRDYALAASGLLVGKIGGPSVRPYQPDGVWEAVAMPGSDTRDYRRDSGESLYRRSMYTLWKRAAPPASLDIFNAPNRETCTVRRERTNTPLQALVTLNDPQYVEAARRLAEAVLRDGDAAPEARIDRIARRLLARPLRPEEVSLVRTSIDELAAYYQAHPEDAAKLVAFGESRPMTAVDAPTLAAWTMLANEMLNLDEVLNK